MTNEIKPDEAVSVVVARFEVATLTAGHRQMLDYVLSKGYGTNLMILGVAPTLCTKQNPLDYESRRLMIESEYPGRFSFAYIKDCHDDSVWSKNLDGIIDDLRGNRAPVLIGSRDSFFEHYSGKYRDNFEEYKQQVFISGTEQRRQLSRQIKNSAEWRAGVVYATQNKYPTVFSTVDCAIFDDQTLSRIYLAKKDREIGYRFVGGFADPRDDSFETTARREAAEETGLECDILQYVASQKIDDWRYRSEEDKIITHLFAMTRTFGRAKADDDISELRLFEFDKVGADMLVPEHRSLFEKLAAWRKDYLKTQIILAAEVARQLD